MIRIGTRGSDLARWQAEWVRARVGLDAELVLVETTGDLQTDTPLTESGGVGFFTSALEDALRDGRIDCAVHSLKDLPTVIAEGLTLVAIPVRAAVEDLLLIAPDAYDPDTATGCRAGTRVGTSSNRRMFQLHLLQPDLDIAVIRGNVPTRIAKVLNGDYGAVAMAKAAVERLGDTLDLGDLIVRELSLGEMLPAPGQGALAVEGRADDVATLEALKSLNDLTVAAHVTLERELLHALGGGCNAPVGAFATHDPLAGIALEAVGFTADGRRHIRTRAIGPDAAFLLRAASQDLAPLNDTLPATAPLDGLVVLNTRPRGRGQQLTRALLTAGASVWVQPAIQTVTRRLSTMEIAWVKNARDYDLAIVTSPAAIEHTCDALGWTDGRMGVPGPAVVVAMGQATAESVEESGWKVTGYPRRGNTDALLDYLDEFELLNPGCRVLYFRAEEGRNEVPEALQHEGLEVDLILPYRTLPASHPPLPAQPKVDVITFTSPSGVEAFLEINPWRPGWVALAIGPTTREACEDYGCIPVVEAHDPSPPGLVKALTSYIGSVRGLR